jgi:hypothetical protein
MEKIKSETSPIFCNYLVFIKYSIELYVYNSPLAKKLTFGVWWLLRNYLEREKLNNEIYAVQLCKALKDKGYLAYVIANHDILEKFSPLRDFNKIIEQFINSRLN